MKIGTKFLLCSVFSIVNVYARGRDQVLDVQQADDLNGFKMGFLSTWNDVIQKDFITSDNVNLYDRVCKNPFFTPYQDDVSQIRVVFPTENLKNVWGNDNYWIGFAIDCDTDISNTNWHKFTKPDNFNQNKTYTRMTLRVGKCRKDSSFLITPSVGNIEKIQLLYKINGFKSKKYIRIGDKKKYLLPSVECKYIDNFHTILLSDIPTNRTI